MDENFFIASLIGFIPSFGILYFVWGKLEGAFGEKSLFKNYISGWISGLFIAIFFLILKASSMEYLDLSLFSILLFALFTEMFKYMYLMHFARRIKRELSYYGFALGLGIGAIWLVAMMYQYITYIGDASVPSWLVDICFLGFSLSLSAIHASSGALIGYGIYKKDPEKYLLMAMGIQAIFNLSLLPFFWNLPAYFYIVSLPYSLVILHQKIYKGVLIKSAPKEVRKRWIKERKSS